MYRMLKFLSLLLILLAFNEVKAQIFTRPNTSYGTIQYRGAYDSTLFYPTGCGAPALHSIDIHKSAMYFDSCNTKFYLYNPKLAVWYELVGGGGSTNSNIGSGYRLAVPGTNNIKTLFGGLWLTLDSTTNSNALTIKVDSAGVATYFLRRKDSTIYTTVYQNSLKVNISDTASMLSPYLRTAVTSVGTNNGTGITGGTITSTGTLAIDTTLISTRLWRQKGIDSLAALIAGAGSGTVTDVATGYGLSGGPITTTGTLTVDSATLSGYYLRRKDSTVYTTVYQNSLKVNISDTAAMLTPYLRSGSISWPGTIYSTPTTGVVSSHGITFSPTLATQIANSVFAGPATGADATPTFRALVAADIPSLSGTYVPIAGGTMTGKLILMVGTSSIAPLKIPAGTLVSSPADGNFEYDGTHAYVTIGTTRQQLDNQVTLSGAATSIGAFSTSTDAKGLDIASNVLTLHAADGSNAGGISLIAQTMGAGVKTFTSNILATGGLSTSGSGNAVSNAYLVGGTSLNGSQTTAQYEINSNPIQFRMGVRGSTATVATAGNDVFAFVIGNNTYTEATSGTSAKGGGLAILTQTMTDGSGATTDFQNLYVGAAPSSTATNNRSVFVEGLVGIKSTTTPQFEILYDNSNKATFSSSSTGDYTTALSGTSPKNKYSQDIIPTTTNGASLGGTSNYWTDTWTNAIELPSTASSALGVINQNGGRFIHSYGSSLSNVFIGASAGNFTSSGNVTTANVGIGNSALNAITSGGGLVAVGKDALILNTSGTKNTAIGALSLSKITTTSGNTAVGYGSLQNATNTQNTAVGESALNAITSGNYNTGLGENALAAQTGASTGNTAVGLNAGSASAATNYNVSIGYSAGQLITGSNNTIVGSYSTVIPSARNVSTGVWLGNLAGLYENQSNRFIVGNAATGALLYGNISTGQLAVAPPTLDASNSRQLPAINPAAAFEIASTTMGFMPPKMTNAQKGAIVLNGLGKITITTDGTGYTSAPTVVISGGGGTGATATAYYDGTLIRGWYVTAAGSGYTTAPTLTISGGGGTGMVASAAFNTSDGLTVYCTDCTATDGSTGVVQTYQSSTSSWKNNW